MKKKRIISIVTVIIIIIGIIITSIFLITSHNKHFKTYETHKEYARTLFKKISREGEDLIILYQALIMKALFGEKNARIIVGRGVEGRVRARVKDSLKVHELLRKKYPEQFNNDVDVLGRIGDNYFDLRRYEEAENMYRRNLQVFKEKYLGKKYKEMEGENPREVKIEEYKYVVRCYKDISNCYIRKKEYKKAIRVLEEAAVFLDEFEGYHVWDKYEIFRDIFIRIAAIYKYDLKGYDKAMDIYKLMLEKFPDPLAQSRTEIYIGDTYLCMNKIEKAKATYREIIEKYDKPDVFAADREAKERLRKLKTGTIVAIDGGTYEIKDGIVTVSRT